MLTVNAPTDLARRELRSFEAQRAHLDRDALEDPLVALTLALQFCVTERDVLIDPHPEGVENLFDRSPCLIATQPQNGLQPLLRVIRFDGHPGTVSGAMEKVKISARNRANGLK
jgi:hypothetical protein